MKKNPNVYGGGGGGISVDQPGPACRPPPRLLPHIKINNARGYLDLSEWNELFAGFS